MNKGDTVNTINILREMDSVKNYCPAWDDVYDKETFEKVTEASMKMLTKLRQASLEIGYGIVDNYQGCGYATEAVEAVVSWALTQKTITRVIAEVDRDNCASIRVLEKSGLKVTGEIGADGPTSIFLAGKIGISWLNIAGLIIIVLTLVPNIIYAIIEKNQENKWSFR